MCVIFSTTFILKFLILSRIQRDIIFVLMQSARHSCLKWNLKFLYRFFEKKNSNFIKLYPVGIELFLAGGRTDRQTDAQA